MNPTTLYGSSDIVKFDTTATVSDTMTEIVIVETVVPHDEMLSI